MYENEGMSITDTVAESGQGRTSIYKAIKNGELIARKAGRRTIILRGDFARYMRALPAIRPAV